jgi:hypothetical protein
VQAGPTIHYSENCHPCNWNALFWSILRAERIPKSAIELKINILTEEFFSLDRMFFFLYFSVTDKVIGYNQENQQAVLALGTNFRTECDVGWMRMSRIND